MADIKSYETERTESELGISFFFVSKGKIDIVKTIQYQYFQDYLGYQVYNLGFGDYNISTDEVSDGTNSNNDDAYSVFYTVLSTIPKFFETYPAAMLMVTGSDSTPEFESNCRKDCSRKCVSKCKKLNRRINAYTGYVNKNFSTLTREYTFYGGIDIGNQRIIENYEVSKNYNAVFLRKK